LSSQLRAALGRLERVLGVTDDARVGCTNADEVEISQNGGQQIVEVVCQSSRQLTDGFHLL
jgi:hypothetical protein